MTLEERSAWLQSKCSELANVRRKAKYQKKSRSRFGNLFKEEVIPEYYQGYEDAVEVYLSGKLHAEGEFPEALFAKIKPNQREEDYEYMKEVYEPITKDVFLEFSNTAKKSLINGSIQFQNSDRESENPLKRFLFNDINNFDNIIAWASAMIDTKLIDGMGIVAVWPSNVQTNEDGILISEIYAQPLVYPIPMVVYAMKDEMGDHFIVESKEKGLVQYNGRPQMMGMVYRYFGPEFIAECKQVGKETEDTFETTFILEHEIGFTPATRMEGISRLVEDSVFYDSVFSLAIPHLNSAVVDHTGLTAVKQKVMYPTRVMVAQKCNYQEQGSSCNEGFISWYDNDEGKQKTKTCPNCQGSGYVGVVGPMSEIRVNLETPIGEEKPGNLNALNVMTYVAPDTAAPKFVREEVDHHLNMAQRVLHLKSEPRRSGNITATEKDRDKENTEAFIKPISDQVWRKLSFIIEVIGKMMFQDRYEDLKPQIHPAENFDIVTSAELGEMIAASQKAGMPSFMVRTMAEDWVNLMQTTSAKADQIANLMVNADRLIVMTDQEIQSRLARKLVERWEVYFHDNQNFIIESVYADNPNLFELDMGEQLRLIREKSIESVPTDSQALPDPVVPGG